MTEIKDISWLAKLPTDERFERVRQETATKTEPTEPKADSHKAEFAWPASGSVWRTTDTTLSVYQVNVDKGIIYVFDVGNQYTTSYTPAEWNNSNPNLISNPIYPAIGSRWKSEHHKPFTVVAHNQYEQFPIEVRFDHNDKTDAFPPHAWNDTSKWEQLSPEDNESSNIEWIDVSKNPEYLKPDGTTRLGKNANGDIEFGKIRTNDGKPEFAIIAFHAGNCVYLNMWWMSSLYDIHRLTHLSAKTAEELMGIKK